MRRPFVPDFLPIVLTDEDKVHLFRLALEARVKIERFNAMLERSVINQEMLMSFSLQEAIQSTRIEGTQTTFNKVLESNITGEQGTDVQEVNNYLEALTVGKERLRHLPISTRLFLELHFILLRDSRGGNRSPGEYRRIQNFIGPTNEMKDATYVPPEPQLINDYMSNLEEYINNETADGLDPLIRAGIIHGQFETIHPFLDGNGRIGRILITLYLIDQKIIFEPSFFISEELEKSKHRYYGLLNNLRVSSPRWREWLEYFLKAARGQAIKSIEKLEKIEELLVSMLEFARENQIREDIVKFMFQKPIFTVKEVETALKISYNTANVHIRKLAQANKIFGDDKRRNRIFAFYDIIDILEH